MPRRLSRAARLASVALTVAFAAAVAACASTPRPGESGGPIVDPSAGQPQQATTIVTGAGSYSVAAINEGPNTGRRALTASPDTAFFALLEAYQAMGMAPNVAVSGTRTVGVRDVRFSQRLGKRRMSDFLSCGSDAVGLPLADQYRVTLTALSQAVPGAGGGSVVTTQVSATASNPAQSTDPVSCSSTGRLEDAINNLAAVKTAR